MGAYDMPARQGRAALAIAAASLLSACALGPSAPQVPIPDDPGFYAVVDEDDLKRLDGNEKWEVETWPERADLRQDQQFVISDPILIDRGKTDDIDIELWRVAWVRSAIRADGSAAPAQGSQWAVARIEPFRVPLSFRSVGDESDVLHVVPQEALAPGLYSLQLRQGDASRSARFGVDWNSVDKQDYSAAHCVDRRLGGGPAYQPCTTASAAAPGDGMSSGLARDLEIKLIDPVSRTVGSQKVLIVQGMVTNVASSTRAVPMLEAALQDRGGNVLGRWTIAAQPELLSPGQTATFRAEIIEPPAGTARVNVTFTQNASLQP
jgi:hypothetical protein